jgi:YqaJ-like viral recombinase domain
MIILFDVQQNTDEWDSLRIGNPGASSMNRIITAGGKPSSQADAYLNELFNEKILGEKTQHYFNRRMEEGLLYEQDSIDDFQMAYQIEVLRPGICFKDERRLFHISPDGIVADIKWGIETKDALPHVQDERLENHKSGGKAFLMQHFVQVQTSLYLSGYDGWYLRSYCRNMPDLTLEVYPDLEFHKKLEKELYKFLGKLELKVKKYKEV